MNYQQLIVILIILLVIILLSLRTVNLTKEPFNNYDKTRIKYHIFTDFVPEINGKKYLNYLPERHIIDNLNRALGDSDNGEVQKVNSCGISSSKFDASIEKESIIRNLSTYFTDQQEKYNVYEGIQNEVNSTALILSNISRENLNDREAKEVVKFVLMNTLNNYKLDQDSNDIIHVVLLPLVLKDANVIKMYYYDKEIYFVGLYRPADNSKFFNTYPKWHKNYDSVSELKEAMFGYGDLVLDINDIPDRYNGMYLKCKFLNVLCRAGEECQEYNTIMINNINSMNNQISAYNNYLKLQRETGAQNNNSRNPNCPDTEDPPASNVNAKFSFL